MPRDTPPPIPKEVLDEWYAKRRARRAAHATNANQEPLGEGKGERDVGQRRSQSAAPVEAKTVYEAKPVIRDLRKEAVSAFVPTVVKMKLDKVKGQGGLMEPEEADRLEKEGYIAGGIGGPSSAGGTKMEVERPDAPAPRRVMVEDVEDEED